MERGNHEIIKMLPHQDLDCSTNSEADSDYHETNRAIGGDSQSGNRVLKSNQGHTLGTHRGHKTIEPSNKHGDRAVVI